jgi:hypothetical protein
MSNNPRAIREPISDDEDRPVFLAAVLAVVAAVVTLFFASSQHVC